MMEKTFDYVDALLSLYADIQFLTYSMVGTDYQTLNWGTPDVPKPTEAELQAEVSRLQAEYDAQAYARSRASEYPPIGDQLDALWKGGDAAAEMLAKVQAVKSKYPKGEAV